MDKTALRSIIFGLIVFVCSLALPYIGGQNFLWFTIRGTSYFGSSGTLYLVSPGAMPIVLILWILALSGLRDGYISRKANADPPYYAKLGFVIGIINSLILGWLTVVLPIFTWLVMGHVTSLVG